MNTETAPYIHIHAPQPSAFGLSRNACPTCEKRSWFVWRFTEWYGSDSTCLRCGEAFTDEGRCERPFAPRWRENNKAHARELYRRLKANPPHLCAETE